jgi:hypothetical protein
VTNPPFKPTHPYSKAVLAHLGAHSLEKWAARVQELLHARVPRPEAEVHAARELLGLEKGPVGRAGEREDNGQD